MYFVVTLAEVGIQVGALARHYYKSKYRSFGYHYIETKDKAETIKSVIEPEREIPADAVKCFMEEDDNFADNYGECVVFERDTEKLQKMLEQCGKEILRRYKGRELK